MLLKPNRAVLSFPPGFQAADFSHCQVFGEPDRSDLQSQISSPSSSLCVASRSSVTFLEMGFVSFAGRVLFASVFLLSAYQEFIEFGSDGGPAAKTLRPKFNQLTKHVASHLGLVAPHIDMKHVIAATIALKGLGGLLFIFSSTFGAYLLLLYLAFITPIVYDFYNFDIERAEFVQLFIKFTQNLALFGSLLFFLGMKNAIPKRQQKKKVPKTKTG
ncbi:hypothetical protein M5K25_009634 [Dendrobium thyrsiflorum]|uniref:Uncharacterized protein n=1 Tax=Dendrobium thyrsiflorum TaxID=117978 RepID=A0ABD0V5L7_DENTH